MSPWPGRGSPSITFAHSLPRVDTKGQASPSSFLVKKKEFYGEKVRPRVGPVAPAKGFNSLSSNLSIKSVDIKGWSLLSPCFVMTSSEAIVWGRQLTA